MKLDIKSIAILVLLGACILFFGMWFFKGSDTKERIKELEKQVSSIQTKRDSLELSNKNLAIEFDKKQKDIEDRDNKIKSIESDILKVKQELNYANIRVREGQKELAETKKKIEDLRKNPIKREDDDLINSLKEKLNK